MTNVARFTIGTDVTCGDETCGQLRRVIVEPIDRVGELPVGVRVGDLQRPDRMGQEGNVR